MTVKDRRPLTLPATGPFQSFDVGELASVINCNRLKYLVEKCSVSAFKAIKGRDDASGGLVLHFDHDFLPGLTFGQDQKRFLRLLLAFDTVHFPVSDFLAGVDFWVPLFNTLSGRRSGGLLVFLTFV